MKCTVDMPAYANVSDASCVRLLERCCGSVCIGSWNLRPYYRRTYHCCARGILSNYQQQVPLSPIPFPTQPSHPTPFPSYIHLVSPPVRIYIQSHLAMPLPAFPAQPGEKRRTLPAVGVAAFRAHDLGALRAHVLWRGWERAINRQ